MPYSVVQLPLYANSHTKQRLGPDTHCPWLIAAGAKGVAANMRSFAC
jgi:hypothetical protein